MLSACGQAGDKSLMMQDSEADDLANLQEYISFIEEGGYVAADEAQDLIEEFFKTANEAAAEDVYTKVEKSEDSVYLELNSGLGFVYAPKVSGYLTGADELRIITYDANELDTKMFEELIPEVQANFEENYSKPSTWEAFAGKEVNQASLSQLQEAGEKIVFIHGHGGYTDSLGSYIQTGETYDFDDADQQSSHEQIIVNQDLKIIANAEYFDELLGEGDLAESLVILNACSSVADMMHLHAEKARGQLAQTLLDKGADLVVGYDRMVPHSHALDVQGKFLTSLTTPSEEGEVWTAADALEFAQAESEDDADVEVFLFGDETYSFDQTEGIRHAYNGVLDNVGNYHYSMASNGEYLYTLADITGDGIPVLFIQAFGEEALADTKVFAWSSETQEIIEPSELLLVGAASAGGFRGAVTGSQQADGFFYTTVSSRTGATDTRRVHLEDGELVETFEWDYISGEEPAEFENEEFLFDWFEVDDRSAIEALE